MCEERTILELRWGWVECHEVILRSGQRGESSDGVSKLEGLAVDAAKLKTLTRLGQDESWSPFAYLNAE